MNLLFKVLIMKTLLKSFPVYLILIIFLSTISCKKDNPMKINAIPQTQYAEITKAKIAYQILGEGEPLVMCVGYASNMDLWSSGLIEGLKEKYQLIIFDFRGMGLSTNQDTAFTIETLADDVDELLKVLNIENSHVLGWSMGGYVAQMYSIKYPEKVSKLILYATNCGDTITVNPNQDIVDILANPSSTPMELLGTLFPDDWMAAHPEPWKFLPEAKEPVNGETIGLQYMAVSKWLSPEGGSAGYLSKLNMPVLVICGSDDKVVPCINSTILNDSIPNSTLIKVDGTGHGFMYQLPSTFTHYVLTFLEN